MSDALHFDLGDSPPRSGLRSYAVVLVPALVAIVAVAAVAFVSIHVLSAVRAFASGESEWSKSRAEAVDALQDYGRTLDPADYWRFEQALRVPLSNRAAREAMDRRVPDFDQARATLTAAGTATDDVDRILFFYHRLGHLPWFQEPLAAWVSGDQLIEQLRTVAARLKREADNFTADAATVRAALAEVRTLNQQLVATERRFTQALGELGRFVEAVLLFSLLTITLVLTLGGFAVMRRSLRHRHLREQALHAANERWRLAAEGGGLGLYDWDVDRDELRLDGKAAAMYGLAAGRSADVVIRRGTLSGLLHPEDLERTRGQVDAALQHGGLLQTRYRVVRPDGELRHVEVTGVIQPGRAGGARRMVGVVRDVTDEERRFALARERDAAEQAAQARMEFLSRLSHELRTPLNAILGFAQLLLLDQVRPLAGPHAARVQLILDSGRQLLSLVEDVLDITKIDAGAVQVDLQPVEACALVRQAMALVDVVAGAHQVQMSFEPPGLTAWAVADPQRLQQVLMNLLSNACKYNRPGGRVTVAVQTLDARVRIAVCDTGPGIAEHEQRELFQPFKRLAATARRVEGTGLGLFIVKSLVERMNGRIELQSRVGEGSCFTLDLPAAPVPATATAPAQLAQRL